MFRKKKEPPLSREESLGAVVITASTIRVQEDARGAITLFVPFKATPLVERISRWLGVESGGERKIELDEVGSFVWRMCDGRTTVREMIERLATRYRMNRKEAEVSLTAFLRTLARKRLAVIAIMKKK